jgi:hypothetical protein
MLTSSGILIRRSIAKKTRKRYAGPILSQMTPAVTARMPLATILKSRLTPIHLPICSGGTSSLSRAAAIAAPRPNSPKKVRSFYVRRLSGEGVKPNTGIGVSFFVASSSECVKGEAAEKRERRNEQ